MTQEFDNTNYLDNFSKWYLEWRSRASICMIFETLIGIPEYEHDQATRHAIIAELTAIFQCWSDEEQETVKNILIANHNDELWLRKMDDWEKGENNV